MNGMFGIERSSTRPEGAVEISPGPATIGSAALGPSGIVVVCPDGAPEIRTTLTNEICHDEPIRGRHAWFDRYRSRALSGHKKCGLRFPGRRSRWSLALGWFARPLRGEPQAMSDLVEAGGGPQVIANWNE